MDIVLSSTTSSQKELEHAVSEDWRDPAKLEVESEAPAPEPKPSPATEPEEPGSERQERKSKGGFQKKIDRLTKTVADLRAELDAARANGKPLAETPAATEPAAAGKEPKIGEFKSVDEYLEAKTEWLVNQKLTLRQQHEEMQAVQEERKEIFNAYNQKVAELEAEHDDFAEVVGRSDIQIPESVRLAVLEMENGPQVAYYLGQHPEECDKLCEMTPFRAVVEIGKIADKLEVPASTAPKNKTMPPPPIRPVGGNASPSSIPLDKLSPEEYIRVRNQQEREKRRRY